MKNPNMTNKERGLLKGAARRVFSRSELRRAALELSKINFSDPNRPRVKKWSRCPECNKNTPTYKMEVDHISPVIFYDQTLEDMSWDLLIDRIWCNIDNLRAICSDCHKIKTSNERKLRKKRTKK